jgi:hypothetical protein
MGIPEIEAFLTHLAVDQKVAASMQNQALNAILLLYREVLKQDLEGRIDATRATVLFQSAGEGCVDARVKELAAQEAFQSLDLTR